VIRVEVRLSQSFVECRITDNGKAAANIRPGRGLEIVEALAKGLHGKIDQQFGPQGATTVVIFPILRSVFQSCGTPLERFNNLRLSDADASAQTMPDASPAKRHLAHHRSSVEVDPAFRRDVLKGLDIRPRAIPARWFYDRRGSELFEAITALPEYYPTRVERSILSSAVTEIAALTGPARAIVELGSGSSAKTSILLSEIIPSAYVPIDISGAFLRESATTLSQRFPNLPIYPLEGDFTGTLALPEAIEGMPRLGFFPGSTIGNLGVPAAVDLLQVIAATLGPGSMLLIGIDRIKDTSILLPAYDDAQGVTAAFNLNLLHRINRELMGSVPVDAFRHRVQWNDAEARIEMHLEATRDVRFGVAGRTFSMAEGETIHTENSFKYGLRTARMLLRAGGWAPIADWTDQNGFFSLILTKEGAASSAP
jgi:dimethylhistidine N-methyltransferase